MKFLFKAFLLLMMIFTCVNIYANTHTIISSNLSKKKTDKLIFKITEMYRIGFDVNKSPDMIKKYLAKNYILYSNSQKQNSSQLIAHLQYLHAHYQTITQTPFELIQITNNFVTLKYKVFLTNHSKTEGFNFIAIYHFHHDKVDRTWEVASPISAKNIR